MGNSMMVEGVDFPSAKFQQRSIIFFNKCNKILVILKVFAS